MGGEVGGDIGEPFDPEPDPLVGEVMISRILRDRWDEQNRQDDQNSETGQYPSHVTTAPALTGLVNEPVCGPKRPRWS